MVLQKPTLDETKITLLREEFDIDDEMDESEPTPEIKALMEDDPYFVLAQRLANTPDRKTVKEEGEVLKSESKKLPQAKIVEEESKEKRCPVCNIKTTFEEVSNHVAKKHPDLDGVVCPHCCKILSKRCTLNRHIEQVHMGLQIFKPAKCDICKKVFSKKGHLDR